ncbi:MAG: hypothetical protein K0U98_21455 [Deltaproteobacteria bacterium]|nr:hypothetical protein [Deltaproteobacteria bacterium]
MSQPSAPVATLLGRLRGVRRNGEAWEALCPSHNDTDPSLSVDEGENGRALVHCHAGCAIEDIVAAVGLEVRDLFPSPISETRGDRSSNILTTYDYENAKGKLLFQVCRMSPRAGNPKPFFQRRPHAGSWAWGLKKGLYKQRRSGDFTALRRGESPSGAFEVPKVERVLYRLPALLEAINKGKWVVVCEGEKDADNGAALGLTTTTNPGGAGKWRRDYSVAMKGARAVVIPDADEAGLTGAKKTASSLLKEGVEVRIVDLKGTAKGFDLSDWIELQRREGLLPEEIRKQLIDTIEASPPWRSEDGGVEADSKPTIRTSTNHMQVVDQAISALAPRSEIFHRGGTLVHVIRDEAKARWIMRPPNSPTIQPAAAARIREVLSDAACWLGKDLNPIHPPQWAVQALMARGEWDALRPLEGIVESPVLKPDGGLLETPGYDQETGLLLLPNAKFSSVPNSPGEPEAAQAVETLLEAVADFPFETGAHRSAWLASVLTVLARFAFHGPSPLFLLDANVRGAGKSLLADVTSTITLGRPAARMAPSENEAEERKRITALAIAGDPLILIDNVSGALGSTSLDAALTATTWSDRLLGENIRVHLPLKAIWLATGNNITLRGDTSRRSLHIRLDSPEEFPERRQGFRHPDLLDWVARQRPSLVAAALTVLRAFVVAGKPDQGLSPWGSFESWSRLIRNAIVWAGEPDPGETREALQTEADRDRELIERLLRGWSDAVQEAGRPLAASEVLASLQGEPRPELEVLRSAVADLCTTSGTLPSARVLGNRLKKYRRRVVGGLALRQMGRGRFGMGWTVEKVGISPKCDSDDSSDSSRGRCDQRQCSSVDEVGGGVSPEESTESSESPNRQVEGGTSI